ncbi:tetraspanin-18-like [Mercenaria mercenaria]|uniref:tetraspanin-18-like n=1 Tax=Mercenaria mercenaria TaxID=6596 RepID=UPI001E1E1097|nr:tetraspanin-18-like [Mercenaria mercenaria]
MSRFKSNKSIVGFLCCMMFLFGAAVFVDGVLVRFSSGFFGNDAVTLLNKVEYQNIKLGYLLSAHVYGMIIHGGFVMFKAVFGLSAAVKRNKCGLRAFVVFIIILIVVEAVSVGFWISVRGRSGEWLRGEMLDLLGSYKGPQDTDDISKGWNKLFMQARCCGVVDQFANGDTTGDFQDTQSLWFNTNANSEKVPATCCQGVDDDDISSTINTACTTTPKNYYTQGCYEELKDLINLHSVLFFCAAGGLLILQLFAILGACMLIDRGSRVEPMFKTDRPPTPLPRVDRVKNIKF